MPRTRGCRIRLMGRQRTGPEAVEGRDRRPNRKSRLKRCRADHLPAMAPADLVGLVSVDLPSRTRQQLLEKLPSGGRGIEEEHPAGFGPRVLPPMSPAAPPAPAGPSPA